MKKELLLDFSVDRENQKINVEREFEAPVSKVWDAWTKPELLDKWWAPKPWRAKTKKMDFRSGGFWLYAMVGPEGDEQWCKADFISVTPQKRYVGIDYFCDAEGNKNEEMPTIHWDVKFSAKGNSTLVSVQNTFDKLEDLERIIEMGFKEGFLSAMENLDGMVEDGSL